MTDVTLQDLNGAMLNIRAQLFSHSSSGKGWVTLDWVPGFHELVVEAHFVDMSEKRLAVFDALSTQERQDAVDYYNELSQKLS